MKVGLVAGERPAALRQAMKRDGGAERRRVAPMLDDRHLGGRHVADGHIVVGECLSHELAPRVVERPEGRKPRFPVGGFLEGRGRLPQPLPEGAGEGVGCLVAGVHGDIRDALVTPVGQPERGPLHAGELDVAMHRETEGRRELPVEVVLRVGGDAAQRVEVQIVVEMPIDMVQHPLHPGMVGLKRRRHRPVLRGEAS